MDNHDLSSYLLVLLTPSLPVTSRILQLCDLVVPSGAGSGVWVRNCDILAAFYNIVHGR